MERDRRKKSSLRRVLVVLILLGLVFCGLAIFRVGGVPSIAIEPELPGIGRSTPVTVRLEEPRRGLHRARVELVQGDRNFLVAEKAWEPQPAWKLWGSKTAADALTFEVGGDTLEELQSGEAILRVTAERAGSWLRNPLPVVEEVTLPVRLSPPTIGVISSQHNVQQGGSGVVVYRLGAGATKSGVAAGERWFPGFPLPGGGSGDYFALFGLPYDLDDPAGVTLVAQDDLGNRADRRFLDTFAPKPVAEGTIRLNDNFMSRVVPEILANTPSVRAGETVLDSYLAINGQLRKENRQWLTELAGKSETDFLWRQPFLPMKNAQVMSPYAVRRTYTYNDEPVDTQYHLGFDLASVRRAPIESANAGVVAAARFVGIYGNLVVVDHGYGLMTLYAHLSSIEVEEGERVERGQVLGRSGETGLAGGDHLHFGILVQGMPVNPVEWWDAKWIRERFAAKLGEAFPYEG